MLQNAKIKEYRKKYIIQEMFCFNLRQYLFTFYPNFLMFPFFPNINVKHLFTYLFVIWKNAKGRVNKKQMIAFKNLSN